MKKNILFFMAVVFFMASILCSCGGKDEPKPEDVPEIDIDEDEEDEEELPDLPDGDGSAADGSQDIFQDGSYIESTCVHNIVIEPAVEPTCASDGWTYGAYCTECGIRQEKQRIPALPHTWKKGNCSMPTVCTVCKAIGEEAPGHSWEQGVCTVCTMPMPSEGLKILRDTRNDVCIVYGIGSCTDTDVVIPDVVNNCPVVGIRDEAFRGKKINSIYIPDSVTSIGSKAFWLCSELTQVFIGQEVTEILEDAFGCCTSLDEITVADGNETYYAKNNCLVQKENNELILGCKSSVIPDSVTSIADRAFYKCEALEQIVLPNSITSIGEYVFYGCKALEQIVLPNSITSIGGYAFYKCEALEQIVLPNSITSIGEYVFYGCKALEQIVLPNSITSIGGYAFAECAAFKSVILPDQLEAIEHHLFSGCTALENVFVPGGITRIGAGAFENCEQLRQIELSDSLTLISDSAFRNCIRLTSLTIPDGVRSIGRSAISGCNELTEVKLSGSLTTIGQENFCFCPKLKSVVIPESVIEIGYDSFISSPLLNDIYCEVTEKPNKWNIYKAMDSGLRIHWKGSWHYVDGVPTPK